MSRVAIPESVLRSWLPDDHQTVEDLIPTLMPSTDYEDEDEDEDDREEVEKENDNKSTDSSSRSDGGSGALDEQEIGHPRTRSGEQYLCIPVAYY